MPTINKGSDYFGVLTYTGDGAASKTVVDTNAVSFTPDFVWIKGRSGATDHALYDAVRGTTKDLVSNSTAAETTQSTGLTAFTNGGFTIGNLAKLNTSGATYTAWCWKANGAGSSNTSGSITSTVSVNTTAGFSVVTFTGNATAGATVGHGLGVAPKFVIYKARNNGNDWWSYHVGLTSAAYAIQLNTTNAQNNTVNFFNSTAPSASVLTLGYWNNVTGFNLSTQNYVAYCWAAISGYSAFGSYTGNGSADSPFLYLGFRPKFILFKRAVGGVGNWLIYDSSRDTYNQMGNILYPNLSSAEYVDSNKVDFLSNGVKIRSSQTDLNTNGDTYIYAAFAENPFKNANAR